jgi:hypothetical protein
MRSSFAIYASQPLRYFPLFLDRLAEDKLFYFSNNGLTFSGIQSLHAHLKEQSLIHGLSYHGITRIDDRRIAVNYWYQHDSYFLAYAVMGNDATENRDIHLRMPDKHKLYGYPYIESLREHCENAGIKAKFFLTNDGDIKANICGLAHTCHVISLHRREELLRLTLQAIADPKQQKNEAKDVPLLTSRFSRFTFPFDLPCHIIDFPSFQRNFDSVCLRNGIKASFAMGTEHIRRINVSTNSSDSAVKLTTLLREGAFNIGLHHRRMLTPVAATPHA